MYVLVNGAKNNKQVYVIRSFRDQNGKSTSEIFRKLGNVNDLLPDFNNDYDAMMAWAKEEAVKETKAYVAEQQPTVLTFSPKACIIKDQKRSFNAGYLFLQKLCTDLRLDNICRTIRSKHKFKYDLHAILTDLVYARILAPSSKLSCYEYCSSLLEPPKYSLQDVYRALSVLAEESDYIQAELYKNSNFVYPRDARTLYYDCTNYYFEIEIDDDFRRHGKSKENRPNPIVTMGLFMDANGIPLAFDLFPGNMNEQKTLKQIETRVIRDFENSKFIFCSDAGLGSRDNRNLNSMGGRSYIITQSLKKLKKEDLRVALNPKDFKAPGSEKRIDLTTLDENNEEVYNTTFYKEMPLISGNTTETLIVTYSPKYKAYQRNIRNEQVERAKKAISNGHKRKGKNQNDPARFITETAVTPDGEIAKKNVLSLNDEKILEEEQYDGFYAVVTNLDDNPEEIVKVNHRRWEIEECFRIMKTEFEARPVYVQREDRIKAHFLTCFTALLVYRLLEKKLEDKYTCAETLETIRNMQLTRISENSGYVPSYERTDLTDELHKIFGFRTDYEFLSRSTVRSIIKDTKKISKKPE